MHTVEAQEVGVGLDRAKVVDRHDLDIGAAGFDDPAQHVAADPAKAVDGYLHSHGVSFPLGIARGAGDVGANIDKTTERSTAE